MIIKRISIRRKHLNALFFDMPVEVPGGNFSDDGGLLVDRGAFDEWNHGEGDEVSADDLEQLVLRSQYARAESKALWLLDMRDYTSRGMRDKLRRDFGGQAAEYAVERMIYLGLIDDERYAERYAEQLMSVRNMSRRETRSKLLLKGIPRDTVDAVLERIDVSSGDQLDKLIETKYASKLDGADAKQLKKVIDSLMRKGFSYSDIRSALTRYCDAELYD